MRETKLDGEQYSQCFGGKKDLRFLGLMPGSSGSHSEMLLEILPLADPSNPWRMCHDCPTDPPVLGRFLHHIIDHAGQRFVHIVCEGCAPEGFKRIREKAVAG